MSRAAVTKLEVGQVFGRWTVVKAVIGDKRGRKYFVRCDCGATGERYGYTLTSGASKSCGCFRDDVAYSIHSKRMKAWWRRIKTALTHAETCTMKDGDAS